MKVRGFFPEEIRDFEDFLERYSGLGFQATQLYRAGKIVEEMIKDESYTKFLGFTSNIISSGLREVMATFVREGWADVIVTTVGGVEEDIMKSLGDFEIGEWDVDDVELRMKGINRIGNIFVRNELYEALERYIFPVFDKIEGRISTIEFNKMIGESLKDKRSFLYWAAKNNVPVVVPAPTDGALGLMLYFYREQTGRDIGIDPTADMKPLAEIVFGAEKTGALIVGGGVPKHHIIGMNLVRGGLDKSVYITTAVEWDGSLSGARPHEAKSWGKIKGKASTVTVFGEATLILPLLVMYLWKRLHL